MRTTKPAFEAVILAAAFTVAACGGGGGGGGGGFQTPPDGQLSVRLADSPFTDVSEIRLEIDRLRVKPEGERPLLEFDYDLDVHVDLLTVTLDSPLLLLDGEVVRADDYDWIELDVNAEFDGLADSYVLERAQGGPFEIDVPGRRLTLHVDETTLRARRAAWVPREHEVPHGFMRRYRRHVRQACEGAILD